MQFVKRGLAFAMLTFGALAGCLQETPDLPEEAELEGPSFEPQSVCTATTTCGNGTSVQCSGVSSCYAAPDGCGAFVRCDGATTNCSPCPTPPASCTYNGKTYPDGMLTTEGRCVSGVCTGPCDWFPRKCTWNMNCKAVCDDGEWLCDL